MNPRTSPMEGVACKFCNADGANFDVRLHGSNCPWAQARREFENGINGLLDSLTNLRNEAYERHVLVIDEANPTGRYFNT